MSIFKETSLYIVQLYNAIPAYIFDGLISMFCLGSVIILAFVGCKKGLSYIFELLLTDYGLLLLCSTVIFRTVNERQHFDFHPFWSYVALSEGRHELMVEDLMNIVAFIPVSLLLGGAFGYIKWWKVLLFGCGASLLIETLQFVFHRGFSELDDVMHNTLGCMIGYGLYSLIRFGYEKIFKRSVAVL